MDGRLIAGLLIEASQQEAAPSGTMSAFWAADGRGAASPGLITRPWDELQKAGL
jgi:hypothetical protein